jgi:NADH-quinone oxidoreductase subunit E
MTLSTITVEKSRQVAREVSQVHGATRDELIPILTEVNHQLGYLTPEALDEISTQLKIPSSQVFSVASFYSMLSVKPRGRHVVKFCESAPCHVQGGREVLTALQQQLGIKNGETSSDGRWTLEMTICLGQCAEGPVMLVDDDLIKNVTPDQIAGILAIYE